MKKMYPPFLYFIAHQLYQPYVTFCIAFSIKQFFPLANFPHWGNDKMKDLPSDHDPQVKTVKSLKSFSYLTMKMNDSYVIEHSYHYPNVI